MKVLAMQNHLKRTLLILTFVLLLSQSAFAQTAYVQSQIGTYSSGSTFSRTITPANGNLLSVVVTFIASNNSNTVTGCADGGTNTYTAIDSITDTSLGVLVGIYTFYAKNITGGSLTITCSATSSAIDTAQLRVIEVSGADTTAPLDQHRTNPQTTPGLGADAVTSGLVTTTGNGEFIQGAAIGLSGGVTLTAGTGYTADNISGYNGGEYKLQASAGSVAATFAMTFGDADNSLAAIATFKAAAGGGAAPHNLTLLGVGN